jgi:hypothetical protein
MACLPRAENPHPFFHSAEELAGILGAITA